MLCCLIRSQPLFLANSEIYNVIEKRRKNLPAWQWQSTVAIANVCKGVELIVVMFSISSANEPQN